MCHTANCVFKLPPMPWVVLLLLIHFVLIYPLDHFLHADIKTCLPLMPKILRLLPICCSKIENAHNVESDIAININSLRHILIS